MKKISALVVLLTACSVLAAPSASAAVTTYLRPDSDASVDRWTIVGDSTAWRALDDEVTEYQPPNNADYVKNATKQGWLYLGLGSLSLPGRKILSATAWFYTPTASSLEFSVRSNLQTVAFTSVNSSGWHALPVPLSGSQAQLDDLQFVFKPGNTAEHQVSAAFLRLEHDLQPKVYWGSWMDGEPYGSSSDAPWNSSVWETFEKHAGGKPSSIVHFGQKPPWENQPFDEELMKKVTDKGAIPLMDMANDLPYFSRHVTLKEISEGKVDTEFGNWAAEVAAYGKPFFLRWDWEMNGSWFPWSKEIREGGLNQGLYREAWQHLHGIAASKGAANITWVWCPNVIYPDSLSFAGPLYPGDAYVDWTCMDGYNRGSNPISPEGWRSFSQTFSSTYEALLSRAPTKPIMIGEWASTESGGSKAAWIADALKTQLPLNFPAIKAIVWFNWNIQDGEGGLRWDWPIESSPSATSSFAEGISSPYYAGNTFGNLPSLTKIQPLP